MGKGARERRKRREAAENAAAQSARQSTSLKRLLDIKEPMEALLEVDDRAAFAELVAERPEVIGDSVLEQVEDIGRLDGFGSTAERLRTLIEDARMDPPTAWTAYDKAMSQAKTISQELAEQQAEIDAAVEEGRPADVIRLVDEALPKTREAGLGVAVGLLHTQRAKAFFQLSTGDRADNVEQALASYRDAVPLVVSDEQRADLLMHAGMAYLERIHGDRAESLDQAVSLIEEALNELDPSSPPELWAVVRHNLATAYLRRERGDRIENLERAVKLCRKTLQYRSPNRDAVDWAYTQVTLGGALQDLAGLGKRNQAEARDAFEQVLASAELIADRSLVGAAHYSLGRLLRIAAQPRAEEIVEAYESGGNGDTLDRTEVLEEAREHLQAALPLADRAADHLLPGRILDELSSVLASLEDEDEAIETARRGLAILRPNAAPRDCVGIGFRLGTLLTERGRWNDAAAAYGDAVQASELLFHSRLETESREREVKNAGNLSRWAAFAFASAGDPIRAALLLESGRARELRRRLASERPLDGALEELPNELRAGYQQALRDLAGAPLDQTASASGRRLEEVLAAIRAFPGFERFGTAASEHDVLCALEPDWPLLYVDPTPWGTLLLRVVLADDRAEISARIMDQPTSLELYLRLMAGDAAEHPELLDSVDPRSYLYAIGGYREEEAIAGDVEESLAWLGRAIARPIRNWLAELHARGVTLVPCGPIGLIPINAAPWEEDGRWRCLLDEFEVRFAPSAAVQGAALKRTIERREPTDPQLVALSNPTNDLPATGPEVTEIEKQFAAERTSIARDASATAQFLRERAAQATYLHLACHASASLLDSPDAGIDLADRRLGASEVPSLGGLGCRLAVVSACQSAISSLTHLPDEGFSIGNAMLAAGAACAIASLWPVDDLATALLMTRLYEEILGAGHRPPEALRRAQIWLRDLSPDDEQAFLFAHPALEREFRCREDSGREPRRRRSAGLTVGGRGRYAHPEFWAPFIAVGA